MYSIDKKINIILVGSGKAGNYHAKVLSSIKNVKIFGVMNSGKKDPIEFRNKYSINNWITDLGQISEKIDAFIIACSSEMTLNVIKLLSNQNIPMLIEKPLGISSYESMQILTFLKENDLNFVGFNRRFYSCVLEAQKYIDYLGSPISIHIDAPEPLTSLIERGRSEKKVSNRLLENTTHALDILSLFFGECIEVVNFNHNSKRNDIKIDYMSFIKFKNNKTASFISHWGSPGNWEVKFYGEDYQIKLNLTKNHGEINSKELGKIKIIGDKDDQNFKLGILKQNYYFLKSVINGKIAHSNLCILEDGHKNNKFAEKLMR
tara:strand:- start:352 stop:1308 length:957 start_codon:yes stop_codon:yes gene_type:complete